MNRVRSNNMLVVGNYASSTGYAWNTISEYFIAISEMMSELGWNTIICYPVLDMIPEKLRTPNLTIIEFDFLSANLRTQNAFLRNFGIGTVYLTDQSLYSWKYLLYRLAGVRHIIDHGRVSGRISPIGNFKKSLKSLINYCPLFTVDAIIVISEFVKEYTVITRCFPKQKVFRIWNGIDTKKFKPIEDRYVFQKFGISEDKKIIFSYSRADREKGITTLIDAADILINRLERKDLFFLYCGDGPDLDYFNAHIELKNLGGKFICPGVSNEIDRILRGVSIVVVPTTCQEAFGLSIVEGMACERVVIASMVGGIPEIIIDNNNGLLFPPGDAELLAIKILGIVNDNFQIEKLGKAARETVLEKFDIAKQKEEVAKLIKSLILK